MKAKAYLEPQTLGRQRFSVDMSQSQTTSNDQETAGEEETLRQSRNIQCNDANVMKVPSSSIQKLLGVGKGLGLSVVPLREFIKEQQDRKKDERSHVHDGMKEAAAMHKEAEKVNAEMHLAELQ